MTEDKDTVSGKVASITPWKSGKGSWINLEGDSNDFFAYTGKVPKMGTEGTWEVKEGKGFLADKVELVKLAGEPDLNKVRKESSDRDMKLVEKSIESGEKTYFERQNLIIRQCCIKAAAGFVGELFPRQKSAGISEATREALWAADKFYDWVISRGEKLPEPPEEP